MVPRSFLQGWEGYQLMDLFHVLLGELPSAEKAPCLRLFPDGSLLSRTGPHRGIKAESHPSNWDNSEGTSQLQSSQKNGTKVFVVIASKVFSAYFTSGRTGMIPRALPTKLPGHKFPPHSLFPRESSCNNDQNSLHRGPVLLSGSSLQNSTSFEFMSLKEEQQNIYFMIETLKFT